MFELLEARILLTSSLPGADHTIYLDFDGHITEGTPWDAAYNDNQPIVSPPSVFDAATIDRIWQSVAEDFSPFEVNVTTEDPGLDALTNTGGDDTTWGIRAVIGGSCWDWLGIGAGGVALYGSFDISTDTPVFIFEDTLGGSEKAIAEVISHELGHALHLGHDGTTTTTYYAGFEIDGFSWAPIMGVGKHRELTQWSQGEYPNANNDSDDLAILTTGNGFGYRADDHGSTTTDATPMVTVTQNGIIEQREDVDIFTFTTEGGLIDLEIVGSYNTNLNIKAELLDSNNNILLVSDLQNSFDATLTTTLDAGTYYVTIDGVGQELPDGYTVSDYGSLGQYFISGTIEGFTPANEPLPEPEDKIPPGQAKKPTDKIPPGQAKKQ